MLLLCTCACTCACACVPPQAEDPSRPNPREAWSFTAIERIFRAIKSAARLNTAGYVLFGHSAGAQFVHRLLAHRAEEEEGERTHLLQAVAANAGSYMLPSFGERYPFGFGGLEKRLSKDDLAAFVAAPLTILLGQDDTGPHSPPTRHNLSGSTHAARCGCPDSFAACTHQIPTISTCRPTKLRGAKGPTGWRAATSFSKLVSTSRARSARPLGGVCKQSPQLATMGGGCCAAVLLRGSFSCRAKPQPRARPRDKGACTSLGTR